MQAASDASERRKAAVDDVVHLHARQSGSSSMNLRHDRVMGGTLVSLGYISRGACYRTGATKSV
jgi:hypothetical protein